MMYGACASRPTAALGGLSSAIGTPAVSREAQRVAPRALTRVAPRALTAPLTASLTTSRSAWPGSLGGLSSAIGTPAVSLEEGFREADGVIFLNDHPRYKSADLEALIQTARSPLVVFDSWRLFRDRAFTRSAETVYAGIGYEA